MKNLLKKFLLTLANLKIRALAWFMLPRPKALPSPDKVKRILVYGQMGIGNMIMFTPFLKALRGYFPHTRIAVLILRKNGAEQVIEGSNLVDETIIWDYRNLSYLQRFKAIWQMKTWQPDMIVTRFGGIPIDFALLVVLSRAPYRVGHVTSGGWRGEYDYLHNLPVKMGEDEHEIDRDLHLAGALGIVAMDKKPYLSVSDADEKAAVAFLKKHGIADAENFVTVQIGTSQIQAWKRWSMNKWAGLTEQLLQNNMRVVAVGSPEERGLIEETFANLAIKPVNAAGELTLKQTGALIKQSALLICTDSGLMHVAVAVDTPVVAIYGMGHYTRNAPLDKKHIIIRKDLPCSPCVKMGGTEKAESCPDRICLSSITVDEVIEAVQKQLKIKFNTLTKVQS